MKLSDYVINTIADRGIRHVFLVTGGGAMHLNDSIAKEKRITYVCNHHEQACAMAAEAYARISGNLGFVNVTTGPGGINALNGVFGAYTDSIPMLVVSGQVKRETLMQHYGLANLRQLGDQELNITRMASPITKYAVTVTDPQTIRYHLERALHLATAGRPGPVWLDIPVDVQSSNIQASGLRPYDPAEDAEKWNSQEPASACAQVVRRLQSARRPVILAGSGVRIARAEAVLERVIRRLQVPVVLAWTAIDLLSSDDALYCGRPGVVGDRAGNFTVQNADFILVLGSRLAIRQASYNWTDFARRAYKVVVDIDQAELDKPMVQPDLKIQMDCRIFLERFDSLLREANHCVPGEHSRWLAWWKERVRRYPVVQERHRCASGLLNPYHFFEVLAGKFRDDEVIACGDGAASVMPFQCAFLRKGQRMFTNAGAASMGYDLPAAIGAAYARPQQRVLCFAGDGSLQMNIQELQTVVSNRLAIKIFVIGNGGYLSIRTTQNAYFERRLLGESPETGVGIPDFVKVARAYGIPACTVASRSDLSLLDAALAGPGPFLCNVLLDPAQAVEPKVSSRQNPDGTMASAALEDMAPFLDRDELRENMISGEEFECQLLGHDVPSDAKASSR